MYNLINLYIYMYKIFKKKKVLEAKRAKRYIELNM